LPPAGSVRGRRGRLTTLFSPKGGVGKSVLAVNLATALAQAGTGRVALVDLDVNFGDISVMLRLKPAHHVGEAAAAGAHLDNVLIDSLLVHDERSNLAILAAPPGGAGSERLTAESASNIVAVMRTVADHVIVDTPGGLDDNVLQVLSESDDIVFVVGMDVPSVKNARLGLQAMELVGIPLDRIIIALNRSDSRVHLSQRDIERALQMKVDASFPSDALVPQSVNTGVPAVLEFGRSRFAGRVREMADLIADRASERADG
jgi:pilus assembly protein CpaE